MLESISDVNAERCGDGSTLMHVAVYYSHEDLIDILLQKGADINATNNLGQTPFLLKCQCMPGILPFLLQRGADPFLKDKEGRSGLHMAADSGKTDTLKMLLSEGLDINAVTLDGDTPLTCALSVDQQDSALFLLDQGADYHVNCLKSRRTILHFAASMRMGRIIERVLEAGDVDINAKDARGWTALALASRKGSTRLIRSLIAAGANMEAVEEMNDRPLHVSLITGNEDVAIYLIGQGVDVCVPGSYDRTPLHLAAESGCLRAAELILHRDITTEALDDFSRTPLSLCTAHPDLARLLIVHGANVNHADKGGWTPLHYAIDAYKVETFRLLVRAGANAATRALNDGLNVRDVIEDLADERMRRSFEDALDEETELRERLINSNQRV